MHQFYCTSEDALRDCSAVQTKLVQLPGNVGGQFTQGSLPIMATGAAAEIGGRGMHVSAQLKKLAAALHRNGQIEIAEAIAKASGSSQTRHHLLAL
jgi:hypothetical protein